MPADRPLEIAIVGGGIGGLSCALGLAGKKGAERKNNLRVTIYEAAPKFEEIGAGVSIGPNAVHAMGLMNFEEEYLSIADECPDRVCWFEWRDYKSNDKIAKTDSQPGTVGQSSVHRAQFLDLLVSILPPSVDCKFGHRLASSKAGDDGRVSLTFDNGASAVCDVLLAFDGIKSAVRKSIYSERGDGVPPRWTGTYAYRGLVPYERLKAAIGQHLADVPQMYCGPDSHILTFSIQNNSIVNVVAFISDRSNPVGKRTWTEPAWVSNVPQQQMLDDYAAWGPVCHDLLKCIDKPSRWALHELEELPRYVADDGHTALAGDAAHAMLPHQGAGAGQAIEDAYVLAQLLNRPGLTTTDVPAVLEAYERLRLPRANAVQRTSREGGDLYEHADPEVGADPAGMKRLLESRMKWIWEYDIETEVLKELKKLDETLAKPSSGSTSHHAHDATHAARL